MLHRVGMRVLHDRHDADDVVQLTFIQLWKHPESACPLVAGWLHRVTVNTARNLRRSRASRARREEAKVRTMVARRTDEDYGDLREEIDAALDRLPGPLREAVLLHYLEGRSHEESAQISGCSEEAVRKRSQRGLHQLRKVLSGRGVICGLGTLSAFLASESTAGAATAASFGFELGHALDATFTDRATATVGRTATGSKLVAGSAVVLLAGAIFGLAGYLGKLRGEVGPRRAVAVVPVGERAANRGKAVPRFVRLALKEAATSSSSQPIFRPVGGGDDALILPAWGEMEADGIPFRVEDPRSGAVSNAIVLYNTKDDYRRRRAQVVGIPWGYCATAIHLLGGVSGRGYPRERGESVSLIVRLRYEGGEVEDHPLRNGVRLADYSGPVNVPGSKPALRLKGGGQMRHLAIIPGRWSVIERIEFLGGDDRTAPVVMAVTVQTGG
jgi:RNA polymerase sigma factor (sigma-70 family)